MSISFRTLVLLASAAVATPAAVAAPAVASSSTSATAAPGANDARVGAESSATQRFALVIGVNVSDNADVSPLSFADDDAVGLSRIFREAGVQTTLLVELDDDSRRLHRGLVPAGKPTRARVLEELDRFIATSNALVDAGKAAELIFSYSGHGDVDNGEGHVVLADGRLTRSDLNRYLLERARAPLHVIVDACRSYFLVFPKGPGGERRPATPMFQERETPPNAGFILSTSSDRESHEWERYQGGVFSHEVRSALRGAADVNTDGRVTYVELRRFLEVANEAVENRRFRPDFFVRAPAGSKPAMVAVITWPRDGETLLLDDSAIGHLFLENAAGERLFDVHPQPGNALVLRLPLERPLFVRQVGEKTEYRIVNAGSANVGSLSSRPVAVGSKGAEHEAFRKLFSRPFGAIDMPSPDGPPVSDGSAAVASPRVAHEAASSAGEGPSNHESSDAVGSTTLLFAAAGLTTAGAALAFGIGGVIQILALQNYTTAQSLAGDQRAAMNETIQLYNGLAWGSYGVTALFSLTAVVLTGAGATALVIQE